TFLSATDFLGAATLTITTDDLGNTGAGGAKTDTDSLTVNVTGVNLPPVNTVPGTQTVLDGQTLTFSAGNGNRISVRDPDAGTDPIRVTLSVPAGSGTLTAGPTVPATVTLSGNGTGVLVLTG